jgi:hypothetical protein
MCKSCDRRRGLDGDLSGRLRDGSVSNVANLAMLLAIGLRVPVAGGVRAQPDDGQDERDGQETYD